MEKAAIKSPGHAGVLLQLAKIQLDGRMIKDCEITLASVKKIIITAQGEDLRWRTEHDKIFIMLKIDDNDLTAAQTALERARSMPKTLKEALARRIHASKAANIKNV